MNKKLSLFLLLISVGILTALAAGPVFGSGEDGLGKADAARQKHTDALLAKPGVVGVALGFNPAGRASVTVYTEHRDVKGIPQKLDGVPVHVVVTGKLLALSPGTATASAPSAAHATARFDRPVPIGVSTGHPDITACTIGVRLTDGNNVFALSNNHCYANSNAASIGDHVIQPGTYDGGSLEGDPNDYIGSLADFQTIDFSSTANNVIDAAIVATTADLVGTSTPSDGYGTPKNEIVEAVLNQKVQKYGRTTQLTNRGKITGINATVNIGYGAGTARFVNQIIVKPGNFLAGGDSGSLMVIKGGTDDRKPVGLLFAGSASIAIANPIGPVLTRFGMSIDGDGDVQLPTAGITVSPMSGLATTEDLGTDTFNVVLKTEPTDDVTIGVSSSDTDEGTVDKASLTFTTGNWNIAQMVTITGVDDDVQDGDMAYTIVTAAATSTDTDYNGINPANVSVTNADNEPPPPPTPGLTVEVLIPQETYGPGQVVAITALVTNNDVPVSNATVQVVITTPKGDRWICNGLTTNGSGEATCTHKAKGKDVGTNVVVATSSTVTGENTFEVAK